MIKISKSTSSKEEGTTRTMPNYMSPPGAGGLRLASSPGVEAYFSPRGSPSNPNNPGNLSNLS